MVTHGTQKRRNSEVLWLGLLLGQRCRRRLEKKVTENSQWRCQTSQKETDGALRLYCSNFHKSFTNTLLMDDFRKRKIQTGSLPCGQTPDQGVLP